MRVLKFFGKCLLAFIFFSLIFWTIILGTLQTEQGQKWAFTQLISYLESITDGQIQIRKINVSFPLNIHLEDVTIAQDHHPLILIQELDLSCAISRVLQGRLVFSKLHASHVNIQQLFKYEDSKQNDHTSLWQAPLLPFYLKLENIDIQNITLSEALIKTLTLPIDVSQTLENSSLNIQGMMSHNPFRDSMTAHLLITAKNVNSDLNTCKLGIDAQNHQLSLSFHCNKFPLQTLKFDLPVPLESHLAFYASAPLDHWQHLFQNSIRQDFPIEGHFKLSLHSAEDDPSYLSTLIGPSTTFKSRYVLKSREKIDLFDLKIDNPNFFLKGEAILTSGFEIHHGIFKGEIANLEVFQPFLKNDISGKLIFETHATGPFLSPSLIFHLESPHLFLSEHLFQNVQTTIQTKPQNNTWGGFFTLSFDHQTLPWKIASSFDLNDHKCINLNHITLDVIHSHLTGDLTCCAPDYIWEGILKTETSNLNDISQFFDIPLSGEGHLKLQLEAVSDGTHRKKQGFHALLTGKALRWKDSQASQLIVNLHRDVLHEEKDFFLIQSYLEGQQIRWKDYTLENCTVQAIHRIDLAHRHLAHLATFWNAQNIRWPNGQASYASGEARLQDPLQAPEGTVHIHLKNVQTPTSAFEELAGSTTIHPSQEQWPFDLNGKGFWSENLFFTAEGFWHFRSDLLEVQTNHLTGRFGLYPFQLLYPVYFWHHPNGMQLARLNLKWGEAEIQGEFNLEHQKFFTQFQTNAVPSEIFHLIAPELPLSGHATFQGYLEGSIENPQGQIQIDLHRVQITDSLFAQKPFIEGKLTLDLNGHGIQLKSELNGIGHTPLQISGTLPIGVSLEPFKVDIDSQTPFHLSLNAEGEIDPYLHLFFNNTNNLSGHAKIALNFSGMMNAPQIKGQIDLINGTYESLNTGAIFHNIQGHLEGDGSRIILTRFSAQDSKNGSITATGNVALDPSKHFPFEFQIQPHRIYILNSDYAAISASGPLSLIGNTKTSKLQGSLTVDQAIIHLEEALPRQIKTVDVKYINLSQGDRLPSYLEKKESNSPIELDVKLLAPHNVSIQGNHLKSDWKGSVDVKGTLDRTQLHGDLHIARGEYDFNGKIFNLSQGNIHFAGAPSKKTTLYVVASKDIDRITADIIVKGPVNKLALSFRSNPPLSQREVLSYILFNRGISDITSDQGDQLSQSFISLNSNEQTTASEGFLSRLRNNIGIDRLDFTTNDKENKDFGLQVGKNITENISVSVNQSMTSVAPIIAVEAKLRKNLKAQAEAGVNQDAPVRMSLKWKKDY
jgi:translocation and assembly module TamB